MLEGKNVLIIGGTGSLGGALLARLLAGKDGGPRSITVMSRDEMKQAEQTNRYQKMYGSIWNARGTPLSSALRFLLGDIRDFGDTAAALDGIDIVINAAALKQVPNCEYFPDQALRTNCAGTTNLIRAIKEHSLPVSAVVGISTDKACEPISVMGMTKALQERMLIAANLTCPNTRFLAVRYGNVLSSRGSVIPLFTDQIRQGGPVTVTDPGMTRFLISLDQAVDTIFAALDHGLRGEIFAPSAPSATVGNIAQALIGGRPIAMRAIGMRPGEKYHEVLVSAEEARRTTSRGGYHVIRPMLAELRDESAGETRAGALSSADAVLSPDATVELLARHGLVEARQDRSSKAALAR